MEVHYTQEMVNSAELHEGTELAQVVAMLTFPLAHENLSNQSNNIYLVIAWFNKSTAHKLYPYPAYVYNFEKNYKNNPSLKNKPYMQIINAASVYRPAFVLALQERGNFWETNTLIQKSVLKDIPFYKIPYERAFRRNCDGFVEYINKQLSSDTNGSGSVQVNKIPTNVILNDNDLRLVDDMIKAQGDNVTSNSYENIDSDEYHDD
jgi:hypothetical protein